MLGVLGIQALFEVSDERVVGLVRRGRRGLDIHWRKRRRLYGRGWLMLLAVHVARVPPASRPTATTRMASEA